MARLSYQESDAETRRKMNVLCLCLIIIFFVVLGVSCSLSEVKESPQQTSVPVKASKPVTRLTQASFKVLDTQGEFITLKNLNNGRCFLVKISERGSSGLKVIKCPEVKSVSL